MFLEGGGAKVRGADDISWVVVFVVTPRFFERGRSLSASNPDELLAFSRTFFPTTCNIERTRTLINRKLSVDRTLS